MGDLPYPLKSFQLDENGRLDDSGIGRDIFEIDNETPQSSNRDSGAMLSKIVRCTEETSLGPSDFMSSAVSKLEKNVDSRVRSVVQDENNQSSSSITTSNIVGQPMQSYNASAVKKNASGIYTIKSSKTDEDYLVKPMESEISGDDETKKSFSCLSSNEIRTKFSQKHKLQFDKPNMHTHKAKSYLRKRSGFVKKHASQVITSMKCPYPYGIEKCFIGAVKIKLKLREKANNDPEYCELNNNCKFCKKLIYDDIDSKLNKNFSMTFYHRLKSD